MALTEKWPMAPHRCVIVGMNAQALVRVRALLVGVVGGGGGGGGVGAGVGGRGRVQSVYLEELVIMCALGVWGPCRDLVKYRYGVHFQWWCQGDGSLGVAFLLFCIPIRHV